MFVGLPEKKPLFFKSPREETFIFQVSQTRNLYFPRKSNMKASFILQRKSVVKTLLFYKEAVQGASNIERNEYMKCLL